MNNIVATIVKDDNFKTIGFRVEMNDNTMFSWGITPNPFYFTKNVDSEKYTREIIILMGLKAKYNELDTNFRTRFFDCIKASEKANKKCGYNLSSVDEERENIKNQINNIIKDII